MVKGEKMQTLTIKVLDMNMLRSKNSDYILEVVEITEKLDAIAEMPK